MAFLPDLALLDSANVSRLFSLTRYTANGSVRTDRSRGASNPRVLNISHSSSAKKTLNGQEMFIDRHLVQFIDTTVDALNNPVPCTLNLTLQVPRLPVILPATTSDLIMLARNFVATSGAMDMIIRGEI